MEAPKSLRRPINWQDFESLCKKLWGEIWQCPEIQKNGRLGQEQSGVDVFGIPFGEDGYYGIQCKGKSEYIHAQFTEKEINEEIEKVKNFKPALKKYYLTTTALNDSKIQQIVREKNLEHIKSGLFEIHLFAWESIVDLIDENKQTHDWYLKNQNYKTNKSVTVTFQDGLTELYATPKFKQTETYYMLRQSPSVDPLYANPLLEILEGKNRFMHFIPVSDTYRVSVNLSYVFTEIHITNTGNEPIEDYKLFLEFEGEVTDLTDTNEKEEYPLIIRSNHVPNTYLWPETKTGRIVPKQNILVGDDTLISDDIYIKPAAIEQEIIIKWKLISKDFKDNGQLKIKVEPSIETKRKTVIVEDPTSVKTEIGDIEDYLEPVKSKD